VTIDLFRRVALVAGILLVGMDADPAHASDREARKRATPHNQDRPPGPALSPAEAMQKMAAPPGFRVELVAAEPDIVNPVAMTFDERGRIWITESLEYPRKSAGPGRDRVQVLEDTDGDGKADKSTIFADGLNIPSGIAVGYDGVWVANAPDILFLQDTDGDGKADRREVVVTGFGRDDTHELPNSLSWGPDGWLYGLNGVFNQSRVRSGGKDYKFTCAMFRIHPRTHEFQIFCEGTSNPWGIAWDDLGSAFVSACVIDHLWHLVETGYYHRQGGPYPPYTWKISSIVAHKHQKAAYCGLHYFDSDAYPPEYRRRLYMGNIHGGRVNVDVLSRDGSTYFAKPAPDFLIANDAWFMPVSQKTGPDGSLYILDWYDRYHCYQDAGRDPQGIDRLKGRLYRVRYKETPRVWGFDLAKETDDQLLARLEKGPNDYYRGTIVRLLSERRDSHARPTLERMTLDANLPLDVRLRSLWTLIGSDTLADELEQALLSNAEPAIRSWAVRAAGNRGRVAPAIRQKVIGLARDPSADVRLQVTIAARKIDGIDPVPLLIDVLVTAGDDKLIPHIVWNNLQSLMDERGGQIVRQMRQAGLERTASFAEFAPRTFERLLSPSRVDAGALRDLLELTLRSSDTRAAGLCVRMLATRIASRELAGERLDSVRRELSPVLRNVASTHRGGPLGLEIAFLRVSWNDPAGLDAIRSLVSDRSASDDQRLAALDALIAAHDASALPQAAGILAVPQKTSAEFRRRVIAALGRLDAPRVAEIVLERYATQDPAVQPVAIELLTQRVSWSKKLLDAVGAGKIPSQALNLSQVRKLLASGDQEIAAAVSAKWGTVRDRRSPERERVIARMRTLVRKEPGDATEGEKVFKKVCAQCHKLHGEGADVGPDITLNGRSTLDQLLSNVFDPSLVIGAAYRAIIVVTNQGRVLTGLLVEDSPSRVVLKIQGGKTEIVPRSEIDAMRTSEVSLMPEQIENQLQPQEIVDLFTFLSYDKHPSDPTAKQLRGVR
jgi:putative membrane-bound dehydrogenase-like protein